MSRESLRAGAGSPSSAGAWRFSGAGTFSGFASEGLAGGAAGLPTFEASESAGSSAEGAASSGVASGRAVS
ncbi:hypothetical protein [Corynebacterium diphtheriae]|uniref:hypothetical protein n=1 Tax=Corynebacterium diphtheriae TaxID=1717 RepID=UPI0008FB2FAE|nr:hypothetical protein [Corynebacterium diphtheriae]OIS08112.1 hypothetical protein BHF98_07395 [Corynebacterium diphtheriae]